MFLRNSATSSWFIQLCWFNGSKLKWGRDLPFPFAPSERSWVQASRPTKTIYAQICFYKADVLSLIPTFLFNIPSMLFPPWYKTHQSYQVLLYYPVHKAPVKGRKPCEFFNPQFAITPAGSALIVLRSSLHWISSCSKLSVAKPTWLASSHH